MMFNRALMVAVLDELSDTFHDLSELKRLSEMDEWQRAAGRRRSEGDMYGWNFYEGMRAGANAVDILYQRLGRLIRDRRAAVEAACEQPIPMILHCPNPMCRAKHIDRSEPEKGWTNPPHRSHKCHTCGAVWRPADVETTGVASIETRGAADTWPLSAGRA